MAYARSLLLRQLLQHVASMSIGDWCSGPENSAFRCPVFRAVFDFPDGAESLPSESRTPETHRRINSSSEDVRPVPQPRLRAHVAGACNSLAVQTLVALGGALVLLTACPTCQSVVFSPRHLAGSVIRCPSCARSIDLGKEQATEEHVRECLRKFVQQNQAGNERSVARVEVTDAKDRQETDAWEMTAGDTLGAD